MTVLIDVLVSFEAWREACRTQDEHQKRARFDDCPEVGVAAPDSQRVTRRPSFWTHTSTSRAWPVKRLHADVPPWPTALSRATSCQDTEQVQASSQYRCGGAWNLLIERMLPRFPRPIL